MKAFLLYRDQDFDPEQPVPPHAQALVQDLALETLFDAMALGDNVLLKVTRQAVLSSLNEPDAIRYRQDILKDCMANPAIVRALYDVAVEAIESEKQIYWGIFSKYPPAILDRSIDVLQVFVAMLQKLKKIADEHAAQFDSEGFRRFFAMLGQELDDAYFARVQDHLAVLKFRDGVLISAKLGEGNKGIQYMLHKQGKKQSWIARALAKQPPVYTVRIHERDDSGARAKGELRDRGITLVANALAQSSDHILGFFTMVRTELAFYIACLNLHEQLVQMGAPTSFPVPIPIGEHRHSFEGLYDVCLALTMQQKVVGNDVKADGKELVIITGANQGGKSTFLRSVGLSQLMMQCGMFVPAESFCANVCDGLFTHYKREEDAGMKSGKLDEELGRMSVIVSQLTSHSMVLFNESFAATNEREGSEIARQIACALVKKRIKVFFVTHLYEFAHSLYDKKMDDALFLRAERQADGTRTFRLIEGEPLYTSYGQDLYERIFEAGELHGHHGQ